MSPDLGFLKEFREENSTEKVALRTGGGNQGNLSSGYMLAASYALDACCPPWSMLSPA